MEAIREIIIDIESKTMRMRSLLNNFRTENELLKSEVERLNAKLEQREYEVLDFKEKYDNLLKHQQEFERTISVSKNDNEIQIDAIVREIDNCINRLKADKSFE